MNDSWWALDSFRMKASCQRDQLQDYRELELLAASPELRESEVLAIELITKGQ